jgi:small conductance mechanosensitive channel
MEFDISEALKGVREMGNQFLERLPYIVVAFAVFLIFYLAGKLIRHGIRQVSERRRRHRNVGLVLGRLAQGFIIFIGLMIGLVIALPTLKPAQLVEFLGISSVAIGFAFRDILQNFLAGILLLWNEPFRIGDQISMGDYEGDVEDIQTRATTIHTYDNRRIVIPNSQLFTNPVTVNTAFDKRRVEYDIGIGYGDDVVRAKELMLKAVRSVEGVLNEPGPEVLIYEFAASSVNLRVRWWIAPPRRRDALDSRDYVLAAIKQTLLANGIDLPFATQHVLFHDQTEETDGDRSRQREGWPAGEGKVPKQRSIAQSLRASMQQRTNRKSDARSSDEH